jgi:hypothetical protein
VIRSLEPGKLLTEEYKLMYDVLREKEKDQGGAEGKRKDI